MPAPTSVDPRHPLAAVLRVLLSSVLVAMALVVVAQSQPAAAIPAIALDKSGPSSVLVGGQAAYSLVATNPASNPDAAFEYNVSFRDVLPVGVTYVSGSTSPASFGEPQVFTDAGTGQQTLVWSNVADLAVGAEVRLDFRATVDPTLHPVGDSVTNTANVYANSDPRFVPRFNASGVVVPTSYTQSATDSSTATAVSAIQVTKNEPSPEGELLRGVHDHTTVYTIEVENNDAFATNAITVTDYLPAGLEFLGCGQEENGGGTREYPGAPPLSDTPAVGADCPTPQTVSTVVNPPGQPAGTYTEVVWNLGTMGPGAIQTIRFAAGIPQRANTTTFTGGTPTPASLDQGSNLNNNSGPPTREGETEPGLTNRVTVQGTYTGPVQGGGSPTVSDSDTSTVTAEDVAMVKSVSPGAFDQGAVATYTFQIRVSEYVNATDLVITDHLPNGMCPLDDVANYTTGSPADCAPGAGFAPTGAVIDDVVQNPNGTFDITFSDLDVAANGVATVTFDARMRTQYTGGALAGEPTSSGDTFTNDVELTATTTPRPDVDAPAPDGPVTVHDDSSVTISSDGPSLDKTILPNTTPMDCNAGTYVDDPPVAQNTFSEGSRICFQIRVDFPDLVSTRNAVITDFLPVGVQYEAGSALLTGNNDVEVILDDSGSYPVWRLGVTEVGGRFVQPGGVFEVRLSGTVSTPGSGPAPDLTANLAKFRYSNGTGGVTSLRDSVDVHLAAPPPVAIVKGVADVDGQPVGGNPPNTDGVQVEQGDVVTFRIDLTNNGTADNQNNLDVQSLDVWDVLPAGITCAAITAVSNGGACTNPGQPGHPTFTGNGSLSAIRWQPGAGYVITPGQTRQLTYAMTIPSVTSVSTTFTNTAAVRSYDTQTNVPGRVAPHLPNNNIDTSTDPTLWDVPAASDTSNVFTATPSLSKSNVTSITEPGNTITQATIGELVTYTVSLRVPANTTMFNGTVTDPMPTGLTFVSASAAYSASNTAPANDPLPAGTSLNTTNGTLTLGQTYTNGTNNPQLFQVTVVARVSTAASNTHGTVRTNTASVTSTTAPTGGTTKPAINATSQFTVVEPSPTLAKTDNDANNIVVAGQTITYTLTATNPAARPILHDTWVVDCVPDGLNFVAFVAGFPGTATAIPGNGTNGCLTGATRIAWNAGDVTTPGKALSYTATVAPASAGGTTYTNTATLTGSTLNDNKADPQAPDNPNERVYTRTSSQTMTVEGAAVTKSADPTARTIGERGSWTVTATIPANVNFYDSAVIDQLPQGVDPASLTTTSVTCTYPGGATCTIPGGGVPLTPAPGPGTATRVGWLLGDLGSDAQIRTITVTYTAAVADLAGIDRGDVLTNTARLGWNGTNGPDPTSAGATFNRNSSNATSNVTVIEPVLSVDKTVNDATPAPGAEFTYSVVVSNLAGPNTSPAFNLEVTDTVPVGVVVDAGSISDGGVLTGAGANGGGTITWTVAGPIATGASRIFTYDATLADSSTLTGVSLTNTADITEYTSLSTGGRTYDGPQDTATVTPDFPHVSIAKAVNGPISYIGEPKTWTITVSSDGSAPAFGVDVADTLPLNWTYDTGSATVSVAGGPANPIAPTLGTAGGRQTLTWTDLGNLQVGQTIVINYTSTPQPAVVDDPGVGSSVPHQNSAAVTASDATGDTGNASGPYNGPPASATARIHSADVSLVKSHTGSPVAGQSFSWTVVVSNAGPDPARGPFQVVDDLPAQVTSPTAGGPGWTCSAAAGQLDCTRTNPNDVLPVGGSFPPITVTAVVPPGTPTGTTLTNAAEVTAHTYDPDPSNNADTDPATTTVSVDLALEKELVGDMVAGQDATYTVTVRNNGPSDSTAPIVVTDDLPAGTTYVSAEGPDWSCAQAGGTVTCDRADPLAVGQVAPAITVVVAVPADREADVTNTASVDGPDPDPVPANNEDQVTTSPEGLADVAIAKESVGPFVPGSTGTYRFTVNNFGPSYADPTVRITDTLPDELTYTTFVSIIGAWTCSAAGQDVTCDLTGRLAAGDDAVVEIAVAIDPDHTGNTHNEATVTSGTTDPNEANNTDGDDTDNTVESDLAIDKSHDGPVTAGTDVVYDLVVTNNGPSASSGPLVVTDALPAGITYVSATGTDWSCSAVGQDVTCTRTAGLGSGQTAPTIQLTAAVGSDAGPGVRFNFASVTGPETDPDPSNNTDVDPTVIVDDADISLAKSTVGPDPVAAGDTTSFEVVVTNDGPSDADDISVVDALPAGMTLVRASGSGWVCSDEAPITCTRDVIPAGTSAPAITVEVRVGAGVAEGATLTNSATVSTSTPGDDPGNNTDEATVDVVTSADLAIDKSHQGGSVVAGTTVTFDLVVSNLGPSDAAPVVTVTDQLPPGLTFASSDGPWTCTADAADPNGQLVTCTLDSGGLLAGTDAPGLSLTAQVAASVDPGVLTNEATVESGTDDPVPGNNTDTDDVTVTDEADLAIVKSHTDPARVGDELSFTLQVSNAGPSEARNVVVTDTLPTGLDYVSADGTDWTCSAAGRDVTCELAGPLDPNTDAAAITLTVMVQPAAYPGVDNLAEVDSTTPDPDTSDNTSTDTVVVPALVDLAIEKSHQGRLKVGNEASFRLAVENFGPTADPGPVTVTDVLPTGLSYVSATGDGWMCVASGQTVTCEDADGLAVDERTVISLRVLVEASAYPSVVNTASVTSPAEDTDPSNNVADDPAEVRPRVELSIEKDLLSITADTARYQVTVTNEGPNDTVSDVVVVDRMPPELSYEDAGGRGWDCTGAQRTVTCTHAAVIRVGDSASFTVTAAVDAEPGTEVTNVATVINGDTDGSRPSDDATGEVPDGDVGPGGDEGPGGGLPSVGGISIGWLLLGLGLLVTGALAVRHVRRT